jgi:hypothetical protein
MNWTFVNTGSLTSDMLIGTFVLDSMLTFVRVGVELKSIWMPTHWSK